MDVNMVDTHHLENYGVEVINYNRDIEAFNLLKKILEKNYRRWSMYLSPTDAGVNRIRAGIINDQIITEASYQEIIRRYFRSNVDYAMGLATKETLDRSIEILEEKWGAREEGRKVVYPAWRLKKPKLKERYGGIYCGAAINCTDGTIITGKNSHLLHASAGMILNATKHLAGLPDSMVLLPEKYYRFGHSSEKRYTEW